MSTPEGKNYSLLTNKDVNFSFYRDTTTESIIYLTSSIPNPTVPRIKALLYLADVDSLQNLGCLVTGDVYLSSPDGPTPINTTQLLATAAESETGDFYVDDNAKLHALREPQYDEFSDANIESLNAAVMQGGSLTDEQLTQLIQDSAWKQTRGEQGEAKEIPLGAIIFEHVVDSSDLFDMLTNTPD